MKASFSPLPRESSQSGDTLEAACARCGLYLTRPRRLIARVLDVSNDHPDVSDIHRRATQCDPRISMATVYRTLKLFEEYKLVIRHRFGGGPSRYERVTLVRHDHLIDVESGQVIEFRDSQFEAVQNRLVRELGYEILSYRLELFAVSLQTKAL